MPFAGSIFGQPQQYEPPVSFQGLTKSFHASVHHSSAIYFKTNILTSTFVPNSYLSRDALSATPWIS